VRLLDLFCGAGGAAMGYSRAGFDDIVGVDIVQQPRYPFRFVLGDAMEYVAAHGREFDAIHASPPCQRYSPLARLHKDRVYPDMLATTRAALLATARPWVMENVPGAPMRNHIMICGTTLGLRLKRHRHFESSHVLFSPGPCRHRETDIAVTGHSVVYSWHSRSRRSPHLGWATARAVMGIPWATYEALSQAIPPAYTYYIGCQLLQALVAR